MKTIMLFLILISGLEIFFSIFTYLINFIISLFKKDYNMSQKVKDAIKLVSVAVFMVSVFYFLLEFVKVMAKLFNIPLDKSILDIFK
ncbi:hypothetical protein [Caloranaerobacter azorensis]|uniref:Uncharacterized protein n=3 Tax=Caloranaerobacter azorensis TaxID=116090 RepID=A0A1M5TJS4_9FIRM|nr:hypothetical protein [Caloranaerobacter azorensis]KGG80525.1 hypothetical protein Y919_05670 [Caloranaerobacter azorensis H53214]QIB26948.1 hypothetical protein G3A45_06370 [Caloranaerobacter azorensis]SHH50910.1 hypothetical protein SAMN02745135_01024 [Caloranaerobacter azorensis DSM 13643]